MSGDGAVKPACADNDFHRAGSVAAGNQQMEVTMSTERASPTALVKAKYAFVRDWCRRPAILQSLRAAGPYLLVELLLPGGTVMALLLYLYRNRRLVGRVALSPSHP